MEVSHLADNSYRADTKALKKRRPKGLEKAYLALASNLKTEEKEEEYICSVLSQNSQWQADPA